MALLGGGIWVVRCWFFAFVANGEVLARAHTIERESSADEGHWAEIGGNINLMVGRLLGEMGEFGRWGLV